MCAGGLVALMVSWQQNEISSRLCGLRVRERGMIEWTCSGAIFGFIGCRPFRALRKSDPRMRHRKATKFTLTCSIFHYLVWLVQFLTFHAGKRAVAGGVTLDLVFLPCRAYLP